MGDCIFCKIITGEIPSEAIYENEDFKVILDAFPANKGHVLVIPKEHSANAFEIDAEKAASAFKLAVAVAKAMNELDFAEGVNIIQNNNPPAGQTVFHFHIHIIPRHKGDSVSLKWAPCAYDELEASKYGKLISEKLDS